MGNAMAIAGQLTNLEIGDDGQVTDVQGAIESVTLQNGSKITIIGEIRRIMRENKTSAAQAFKLDTPGRPSELISSADSPKLYDGEGRERELEAGAKVTPVYQAKAGNDDGEPAESSVPTEAVPSEVTALVTASAPDEAPAEVQVETQTEPQIEEV